MGIAENIFDALLSWVAKLLATLLGGISTQFTTSTIPAAELLVDFFPFMAIAYEVILYLGYSILFLIVVWQLFKSFGGKLSEGEDPAVLTVRAMLFAVLISFSWEIMSFILGGYNASGEPYGLATVMFHVFDDLDAGEMAQQGALSQLVEENNLKLTNIIAIYLGATSTVGTVFGGGYLLMGIILTVVLLWNYLKLLLEVCERYVVLGVLTFTSPLAFAMGASKATLDVFKNWCRMVASQLFVIIMNVYFLKGFDAMFGMFIVSCNEPNNSGAIAGFAVSYFSLIAYLRVASRFDEYLNQLGLNAAKTGTGPLSGMMPLLIGRTLLSSFTRGAGGGGMFSSFAGGAGFGPASRILSAGGIGSIPSRMKGAFDPSTYVANAMGGQRRGFGGIAGGIANAVGRNHVAANGFGDNSLISTLAHSSNQRLNSIQGQGAMNDAKQFMPGLFGRRDLAFSSDAQINSPGRMAGQFTDMNGNTYGLVASSMQANSSPFVKDGAFGQVNDVDGSGFFVQALDKNGNVSEEGMAALFGAPTIGDGAGEVPSGDFANTFFPGQESITNGLTFSNDASDPFTLNATDADGNTFALRSMIGYDTDGSEVAGMTLNDINGQQWFAQDTTPLNVGGIEDGVSISDGGDITDAGGNIVNAETLGSVGEGSRVPEFTVDSDGNGIGVPSNFSDMSDSEFGSTFFPEDVEPGAGVPPTWDNDTTNKSFSNVIGEDGEIDPFSMKVTEHGLDGSVDNESVYRNGAIYGAPAVEGGVMIALDGTPWYEDTGIFNGADDIATPDNPYTMSVAGVDADGNATSTDYINTNAFNEGNVPKGVDTSAAIDDDYGQRWVPRPEGFSAPDAPFNESFGARFNPMNPYEATLQNPETGEFARYRHEASYQDGQKPQGKPIQDNFGNNWYRAEGGTINRAQASAIERSNASVASYFGLDARNIQYADTSKMKTEGVVDVYNKDGSATRFVSPKGGTNLSYREPDKYNSVKSSNGESWYAISGQRGVTRVDTGKPGENGRRITKEVGSVKWDSRISRAKPEAPRNKLKEPQHSRMRRPKR